jgi:hypothetical protein
MQSQFDPALHQIIFRARTNRNWYRNGVFSSRAFLLRESDGPNLSVILSNADCHRDHCTRNFNECWGEILLKSQAILALDLAIVPDDPSDRAYDANHVSIVGLPYFRQLYT